MAQYRHVRVKAPLYPNQLTRELISVFVPWNSYLEYFITAESRVSILHKCFLCFITELTSTCVDVLSSVDLGHEVHASLGNRGRGRQADISTRRAGIHDMFRLVLN